MELEPNSIISKSFVGNLISRLRAMAKKPAIDSDIGTVFDDYLKKLRETQIYLNNGIFTINFAEAALLLECGAFVYGKKVDLLWDETIKHQKRMLSYDRNEVENSSETAKLEERLQKYRRKRRKVEETPPVEKLSDEENVQQYIDMIDKIDKNVEEDFLTLVDDEHFLKTVELARQNYTSKLCSFTSSETYNRQMYVPTRFAIYVDNEYLCSNTQLCAERWVFAASEYSRQLHYRKGCKVNFIGHDALDNLLQKYVCEKNLKVADFDETMQNDFDEYIKRYVETNSNVILNFQDRCKKLCPRRSSILLTRLSKDVLQNYLDKEENQMDDRQNTPETTTSSESDDRPDTESTEETLHMSTLRSEMSCSDTDSGFNESAGNSFNELSHDISEDNLRTFHTDIDSCSNGFESSSNLITSTVSDDVSIPTTEISTPTETSTPKAESSTPKAKKDSATNEIKSHKRKLTFDDEMPKRKKRAVVFRWLKTTTTNLRKYEKFYRDNYKVEDGEGNLEDLSDLEDEINSDIGQTEQNDVEIGLPDDSDTCVSSPPQNDTDSFLLEHNEKDTATPECNGTDTDLPVHEDTDTDSPQCNNTLEEINNNQLHESDVIPSIVQNSTATTPNTESEALQIIADKLKQRQESQRKYLEWKQYIEGKIAQSTKDSFDIHSYSAKVLNTLSKNETMKFSNLVKKKSASEVVRFFVSTLDLVNGRNVEFSPIEPGKLANDTFEIKLLSMERHHEKLDEYQAPSTTMLEMNLARIQKKIFKKRKLDHKC